jgi:leucyl-tRNA synthetase
VNYAVSINGKKRTEIEFALDAPQADIEAAVLADATVQKWMEGKPLRKFIFVKGKMINVVV